MFVYIYFPSLLIPFLLARMKQKTWLQILPKSQAGKTFSVAVVSLQKALCPAASSSLLLLSGGLESGQGFQFSHHDFPTWPIIKKKTPKRLVYFFHIYYLM